MPKLTLQPVGIQERIQSVDIIRGFAFFGVLVVNFTIDNFNVTPAEGYSGIGDQIIYWPIRFLLDDKFLAIYSFLFGLGFSIQLMRAETKKGNFVLFYFRRLFVLYLIGIVHAILTHISVLPDYAMAGLFLLILYKLPSKFLPIIAAISILVAWGYYFSIKKERQNNSIAKRQLEIVADSIRLEKYVGVYQMENGNKHVITRKGDSLFGDGPSKHYRLIPQTDTTFLRSDMNALYTFYKDSFGKVTHFYAGTGENRALLKKINDDVQVSLEKQVQQRAVRSRSQNDYTYREFVSNAVLDYWQSLRNWSWSKTFLKYNIVGEILPLFLLGLYAGRRKLFTEIDLNRSFLQNVAKWGIYIGTVISIITIGFEAWNFIKNINSDSYSLFTTELMSLLWVIGIITMAMGYMAHLLLLLEIPNWKKRLSFLIPVGRLGLTNYIFHLVIFVLLFRNFGLGLNGIIGPFWRLTIAFPVFVLIVFLSRWWLMFFRMGPLEWLWRSLTYWKIQPIRLKPLEQLKKNKNDKK
jgi:uncharacterized protein